MEIIPFKEELKGFDSHISSLIQHLLRDNLLKYSWTSLYARDRDSKNRLTCNEFAYKKTKDDW